MVRQFLFIVALTTALGFKPAWAECNKLPEPIKTYLRSNPQWTLVDTKDLVADDKTLWRQYHQGLCPGFAAAKLDGNEKFYFGLAMLHHDSGKAFEKLVVLHLESDTIEETVLVPPSSISFTETPAVSVIWRAGPGIYKDVITGRRTVLKQDAIIYEKLEAGALAYYLSKGHFKSVQTSD